MSAQKQKPVEPVQDEEDDTREQVLTLVTDGENAVALKEFREPSGKIAHGHSPIKGEGIHDLRTAFGVRDEFIMEHLHGGIVPNGHEAVHAMMAGKEDFENADIRVFENVPNDHGPTWDKIESTASVASIPPGRRSQIDALYS